MKIWANRLFKLSVVLFFALPLLTTAVWQAAAQTVPAPQQLGQSETYQSSGAHPSPATADVLKMAAAGVGDNVLLAYVEGSKSGFGLSADDIIALTQAKVGSSVIRAMLNRDAALSAPVPAPVAAAPASSSSPPAALNPDPAAAPAPLVQYVPMSPGPGYMWVPGRWAWHGGWVWEYGTWHRPYGFFGWGWGWHRRHW